MLLMIENQHMHFPSLALTRVSLLDGGLAHVSPAALAPQ